MADKGPSVFLDYDQAALDALGRAALELMGLAR
jgi:hypothetical protein